MSEDVNADLIGYEVFTGRTPDSILKVTGTCEYLPAYVECDVLNIYRAKIGETVRPAGLLRHRKMLEQAA